MQSRKISIVLSAAVSLSALFAGNALSQDTVRTTSEYTVVVLGDSNTSGYGVGTQLAFPARLEESLRERGLAVRVINSGVPGDTFGAMLARLDRSVPENPSLVIVQGGYNDIKNGVPPDTSAEHLNQLLGRLQARGFNTVLCGFPEAKWDAVSRRLAAAHNVRVIPGSACYDAAHVGPDGLHMSAEGHAIVAQRLLPLVMPSATR
jgi:acyl-CoA thioesterase-1